MIKNISSGFKKSDYILSQANWRSNMIQQTTSGIGPRLQVKQNAIFKMKHVHSHKYGFSAIVESDLEIDYFNWRHFEFDFPIFEMQPEPIFYIGSSGKQTRYTADGRYINENGEEHMDEVKYQVDANTKKNIIKHGLIESIFIERGIHFNVLTENVIRIGSRASNLSYLHPCWAHPSPIEELSKLCEKISFHEGNIQDWTRACEKHGFFPCLIRRAIAHKILKCDITLPWTNLYLSV
jgi:hypothetical protein